ncbi:hypothetical protein KW799_02355 [Candidatus Parcubacteria bacterium]|nr:hypothetical protein [Candidatus Parcubacteria bacterium]
MDPKNIARIEISLLALAVALFLWWSYPKDGSRQSEPLIAVGTTTLQIPAFPDTPIEARSAYVYDVLKKKMLYGKEPELQWPLASLTKLMSALAASSLVPDYMLVRITAEDIREEGDTGLYIDEQWNIRRLIDYSLITSSNDGIRAVATIGGSLISATSTAPVDIFVERMNALAREIGLHQTYFLNHSGLDISKTQAGGYGSAKDIALLVDYMLKKDPHLLEGTSFSKIVIASKTAPHEAVNTDKAILDIPNVLASKTGYTDLSGGNVVIAFNAGLDHPIIIAVLGSSYDGRFADLEALASSTLAYLARSAR